MLGYTGSNYGVKSIEYSDDYHWKWFSVGSKFH